MSRPSPAIRQLFRGGNEQSSWPAAAEAIATMEQSPVYGILKRMRKILVLASVFIFLAVFPKRIFAVGEKCCANYNKFLPLEPYYYDSGSKKCVTGLTIKSLNDLIKAPCVLNPSLKYICDLFNAWNPSMPVPDFPPRCDSGLTCSPESQTCEDPKSTAIVKAPSCPPSQQWDVLGYCCASNINPANFNSLTALLQVVQNGNLCSPPSAKKYCGEANWVFQDGKCVKVVSFPWRANLTCKINKTEGVDTAIGCVPTGDLKEFLKFLLRFALFASGGIIVLMIMATGYTVITSGGNPEKLQAAKENVIALFSGLALIAFSLILLYTIGQGVLGLPTF